MDATAAQITKLEQKITGLQSKNLQEFQKELLKNLYEIKEALIHDISNLGTVSNSASCDVEDEKDKKIAQLQAQNKRLNYRILHLTRNLREKLG